MTSISPSQLKPYGFNSGTPIHRIVSFQRAACGLMGFDFSTDRIELSALECWITGWRPCARCFPEFDLAKWRELRERDAEEGSWEAIWAEVYAERKQRQTVKQPEGDQQP